jgi:hypothetical protein
MILTVFSSTVLSKPNAWHDPASSLSRAFHSKLYIVSLFKNIPNKISAADRIAKKSEKKSCRTIFATDRTELSMLDAVEK